MRALASTRRARQDARGQGPLRFSIFSLMRHAVGGATWPEQWRSPEPRAELRRGHCWRRRAWPRHRVLPRARARHPQRRGAGTRLARRRQYRAQHHDHPLQLSVGGERRALRTCTEVVGRPGAGAELQCHVFAAGRDDAGAFGPRRAGVQAPCARQPAERHRQRMAYARAGQVILPAAERFVGTAPSGPGRRIAAPWRGCAARRGGMGLCARCQRASASTSYRTAR